MSLDSIIPSHSRGRPLPAAGGCDDSQLRRAVLAEGCALLGAANAWVARHDSGGCQFIMALKPELELGVGGSAALEAAVCSGLSAGARVVPWQNDTLLCTCMSDGFDGRGMSYSLCLMFAGRYELTERQIGMVEGLRSALRVLYSFAPTEPQLNGRTEGAKLMVTCSCCRRVQTKHHGWMNWDDLHFIQTGQACSHTVCEQCAAALYQNVLCGKD